MHGGHFHELLVEAVVPVKKAVGSYIRVEFAQHRRKTAQCLDKSGVALYFVVEVTDKTVVWSAVFVEVLVFGSHLLQCVGHVKGHIQFLSVQKEVEFVGLFDDVYHTLTLTLIVGVEKHLRFGAQQIVGL